MNNRCRFLLYIHLLFLTLPLSGQITVNDRYVTYSGYEVEISLWQRESGFSASSFTIIRHPSHGDLTPLLPHGYFTYTSRVGFAGRDTIGYTVVCGGNFYAVTAVVTVASLPDNIVKTDCYRYSSKMPLRMVVKKTSSSITNNFSGILVGDIDNDGFNEVIAVGYENGLSPIRIYDHELEERISFYTSPVHPDITMNMAIADVDRDGIAEIFVPTLNGDVECYNYDGNQIRLKWISSVSVDTETGGTVTIGDINGDGIPEVLVVDKIFNAVTGELVAELPITVGKGAGYQRLNSMPVLADMDNDGYLEVAGGGLVIKVTIDNPHGTQGNRAFIWKRIYPLNVNDGYTSVADINMDGFLDVIVVKENLLYAWSPYTGNRSSPKLLGSMPFDTPFPLGGSRASIADLDLNGYPEIIWSYYGKLHTVTYDPQLQNFRTFWKRNTTDISLGYSGCVVFDFDNDGYPEVVFRGEEWLKIIDGITAEDRVSMRSRSTTGFDDHPVVADLDKDGAAEILAVTFDQANSYIVSYTSGTRIPWPPARYVWNESAYNGININQNLFVPQFPFHQSFDFLNPDDSPAGRQVFNSFRQQSTVLSTYGVPVFFSADASIVPDSLAIIRESCDRFQLHVYLLNQGQENLEPPVLITTYSSADHSRIFRIDTFYYSIPAGEGRYMDIVLDDTELDLLFSLSELEMVANCAGSGIAHNGGLQFECDTTNNNYTLFLTPEIFYYHHHIRDAIYQDEHYLKYGFDIDDIQTGNAGTLLFQDTVLSDTDCDTVVHLTLDVYPVYEKVDIIDTCVPVEWNGKTYHESGNYVSRFSSTTGCDSTEYLYLTIPSAVYTHIRIEACDSYEWDGELYTESGTYSRKYSSSAGCDSTVTLHLTIIHLETTVENLTPDFCELHEAEIKMTTNAANWRWSTGETSDRIVLTHSGRYWIDVWENSCRKREEFQIEPCPPFFVLPNAITPSKQDGINDLFFLRSVDDNQILDFEIIIYNRFGNLVFRSTDPRFTWDGKYKDELYINAVYQYQISFRLTNGRKNKMVGSLVVL